MLSIALGLLLPTTGLSSFEESQVDFGLKCLNTLSDRVAKENICISPYSLQTAGTLLRMGTSGATEKELGQILEHKSHPTSTLTTDISKARRQTGMLETSGVLHIANGIWMDRPLLTDYLQEAKDSLDATARQTRFPEPGLSQINRWVKDNTKNRISKVFDRLDPFTAFVLANAVWFKDDWKMAFDAKDTKDAPFTLPDGSVIQVKALHGQREYMKAEVPGLKVFSLPMKNSELLIGLPDGTPAKALVSPEWEKALRGELSLRPQRSLVRMPKLEFSTNIDLLTLMQKMGMKLTCSKQADFSRMTKENVWVNQAIHRTFLKLDEEGAEAAAVTAFAGTRGGPPPSMTIDRPFLFALKSGNALLFTGVVNDPRSKE